jgi:AraC family transcriptional regulator of adaptative response/methylated-DNA-[protein]-cysteine methyltransferase
MERAVLESDRSFDGTFFTAVKTTNIFCLPSCPARKPLPKNIEFFASAREAMLAGYRPCLRCKPLELAQPPQWAAALLARIESEPARRITNTDLRAAGIDPARARRWFQRTYGMTFQAYCRARRMGEALQRIRHGEPSDDVALGSGYQSQSGFRNAFQSATGTTPGRAEKERVVTALLPSPLGTLIAGATDDGVCLLEFTDRRMLEHQLKIIRSRFRAAVVPGNNEHLHALRAQLDEYFAGSRQTFTVPLVSPGTPFEQRVWNALLAIPYGGTASYEEIAIAIGESAAAARAVGRANGMNRIAIVIPCHRVITKQGTLGGYGGGLWRKQRLLELERGERSLWGDLAPGATTETSSIDFRT